MGARLSLLVRALWASGPVAPRHIPLVGAMLGSALVRAPVGLMESVYFRWRRHAAPRSAPVFIVGHWRSGTTHLHNLLGLSPRFAHISPVAAGMPDELLTLGRWFRPWLEKALPEDRHVDRVRVTPTSPQEDEIPLANQQRLSVFHAVYFPARFQAEFERGVFWDGVRPREVQRWRRHVRAFMDKIALQQGRAPVLVKNPVYTGRLTELRALWPDARFIHIRRNPYAVFASTLQYYQKLLAELALQSFDHLDLEHFVERTYLRLMQAFDAQSPAVPAGQLTEVSFEELEREPLSVLAQIHQALGWEGYGELEPRAVAYLQQLAGYRKNELHLSQPQQERVRRAFRPYIERWGYYPAPFT